ncbi:MAG: AIR carboxylase family protein [Thaumarchaeota archaeon]|nr:AIR carboxylase family protein [Nitrososphaerota archaeon]
MQKAVILMGSKSDLEFSEKIRTTLSSYSIPSDIRIASAHRTPEYLLKILKEYYDSGDEIVAVTVAGLSDALSGVVAAQRMFPVVACPPDLDKYELPKIFSTAFTPSDVPVAFVSDPAKAGNYVAQIFALSNMELRNKIAAQLNEKRAQLQKLDLEINRKA